MVFSSYTEKYFLYSIIIIIPFLLKIKYRGSFLIAGLPFFLLGGAIKWKWNASFKNEITDWKWKWNYNFVLCISLKRVVKTYVWSLPEHSLQRFLTGIKTRKRKGKKRRGKERIFSLLIFMLVWPSSFFFIWERQTASPRWLVSLRSTTSSSLRWREVHFFSIKKNRNVRFTFILFSYNGKGIKEKEKRRENKKEKQKEMRKILGAKTLRAEFPTQNLYLFLYAFYFLKINVKQFFRIIFFTLGLL